MFDYKQRPSKSYSDNWERIFGMKINYEKDIDCCSQCPYYNDSRSAICGKNHRLFTWQEILDEKDFIPKWCPFKKSIGDVK